MDEPVARGLARDVWRVRKVEGFRGIAEVADLPDGVGTCRNIRGRDARNLMVSVSGAGLGRLWLDRRARG